MTVFCCSLCNFDGVSRCLSFPMNLSTPFVLYGSRVAGSKMVANRVGHFLRYFKPGSVHFQCLLLVIMMLSI